MIAKLGDWIVVASRTDRCSGRRGEIVGVTSPTGEPPYRVRWLDTGHTALVFPGPDAIVVTAAEQAESDRRISDRIAHVQSAITMHKG